MKKGIYVLLPLVLNFMLEASLTLSFAAAFPAAPAPDILAMAKKEGKVVIMGSNAALIMEKLRGFKEKYPFIRIEGLPGGTVATVNRIATEVKSGKVTVDIFEISDDGGYTLGRGFLQKPGKEYPHLRDFEPRLQPSSGLFVTITLNVKAQGVYNTEMLSPKELPASWEEMTNPKWKGKTMISTLSEEMPGRLAWLWRKDGQMNWDRSFDFWKKLRQHDPLITKGLTEGIERIAARERTIFWFASGPEAQKYYEGAPVGLIAFPTIPTSFRSVGIVKGAPHSAAAWLLIDYLTSPEGQFEYTDVIHSSTPMNKKAKFGKYAQRAADQGAILKNTEAAASDFTIDSIAAKIYSPENKKKSSDFFLQLIGIR